MNEINIVNISYLSRYFSPLMFLKNIKLHFVQKGSYIDNYISFFSEYFKNMYILEQI